MKMPGGRIANQAWDEWSDAAMARRIHARRQRLLLRDDLLLEPDLELLLPLALGLLLRLELALLRPELLRPLDAVPRLLREDDDPDLEEEEELRDAMACSFGRLK